MEEGRGARAGDARPMDLGVPGCEDAVEIGRGGFGVVYAARQRQLNRAVAVKVLSARLDRDLTARFDREVRAMGALSGHPHIVAVHQAGRTAAGSPYIVMELCRRGSLADRLARRGPLPWREVLDIAVKMAGALEAAHRHGVVHRDVKPENILVSDYAEEPKLADFGIARLQGASQTATGKVYASLPHAAPELLAGQRPSVGSDVYALGSTLHTLLRARTPFSAGADEAVFAQLDRIREQPVPDLRPRGVPDAVCRVLERAMAKRPGDRYGSAGEVGQAFQAAQLACGASVTPLRLDVGGDGARRPGPTAPVGEPAGSASQRQRPATYHPPPPPTEPAAPAGWGIGTAAAAAAASTQTARQGVDPATATAPRPSFGQTEPAGASVGASSGLSRGWIAGLAVSLSALLVLSAVLIGAASRAGHATGPAGVSRGAPSPPAAVPTPAISPRPAAWTAIQPMPISRIGHTMTLLSDGRVLAVGGATSGPGAPIQSSATIFDPASGVWAPAASMAYKRIDATAILLQNGRVLVAGGADWSHQPDLVAPVAEVYDPSVNSWAQTSPLHQPRISAAAALLPNGRVILVGGELDRSSTHPIVDAEVYDPTTNAWTSAPSMPVAMGEPGAVLLKDGSLLVVDRDGPTALFDYRTQTWASTGTKGSTCNDFAEAGGGLTLLADGRILSCGEIYSPSTGGWTPTVGYADGYQIAELLPQGRVLNITTHGTLNNPTQGPTCAVYNPASNSWSPTVPISNDASQFAEVMLKNGQVLVTGGISRGVILGEAEIYTPPIGS